MTAINIFKEGNNLNFASNYLNVQKQNIKK